MCQNATGPNPPETAQTFGPGRVLQVSPEQIPAPLIEFLYRGRPRISILPKPVVQNPNRGGEGGNDTL